ncbi:sodium:phosphate symporter [Devosia epidermidihirudinis]|uniref:Sodium:phosphate symporter n=1 Tax=Devosia epidermidihirudinis TaxID=1293439 RepID=A0A0F5QL59_9HYPH|nr:Na/Pi cotransporter family protein [Devosia epidermidihirudinis]KKC41461.1 sodium:phosphate symporter [Devosia epidermidihirudinis]
MSSTILLIDLLGAAALLLWGLRMLKAGINHAFGPQLRRFLSLGTRNRFAAFGTGFVTTLGLQSSTAMAIMVSSFVAQGMVTPVMAQAVMLGANVGTSVVTQVLAFDLGWLAPAAILVGVIASGRQHRRTRGIGEAVLGAGLMLLSLKLMSEATLPMRDSEALAAFFALLGDAPIIAILLSAALAAASASSLAVVLLVMSLAAAGGIDAQLCLLLVAGANLGGALPPVLAASAEGPAARRVAVTNLVVRGLGAVILMFAIGWIVPLTSGYTNLGRLVVDAHVGFNIALAAIFLPLIGPLTRTLARVLPDKAIEGEYGPRHLDEAALADPPAALAAATRETLRIGDVVENMLEVSLGALKTNDEMLCQSIFPLDDKVDALEGAVKLYLARIDRTKMDDAETLQANAILDYAINLEHVGDIIERSLSRMTLKKIEKQLLFSEEGMQELEELYLDSIDNLQLAQGVFLSRDKRMARRLMESKVSIRHKEKISSSSHMARLQDGQIATLQTTEIHLDILRDLKRINAHLVSVAYPILEEAGMLRESRLRKT